MKDLSRKLRPVLLILAGVFFYVVVLGVRGVGAAGVGLLERLHLANKALMGNHPMEVLSSPHPLLDVLAIPVAAATHNDILAFGLVSAVAVAVALPAVWRMAEAVAGGIGAVLATGLFLGLPMVSGAATSVGEAAVVLSMWCWMLRLSTKTEYRWWTIVAMAVLAGALALSWAPSIIWMAAWLLVVMAVRGFWRQMGDPEATGMIAPTRVPLALVLAPVAAIVLPTLFFLAIGVEFGALPGAWETFVSHALMADWPPVLYEGELFAPGRPPLTTGLRLAAYEFPPQVVIGAIAALILPATERFGVFVEEPASVEGFAMPRSLSMMTLIFLLGLPWALRTRSVGGVPILLLAAPVMAILAGSILATLVEIAIEWLEDRRPPARTRQGIVVALLGLFLLPGLLETVLIHPFEGSYYNLFAGSLDGAMAAGQPASRDDVLPVDVAQSAADKTGTKRLDAGAFRPHFEAYIRAGYVPPLNFADQPASWQARFRERRTGDDKLQDEPAKRITWGPEDVGIFTLELRR